MPYIVSAVGIENFGLINFALTLGIFFGALVQYGFGITATRKIARHQNDHEIVTKIYSNTMATSLFLAFLSICLFVPIVFIVEKFSSEVLLYIYSFAFIVANSLFPIWFFQGLEKMKYITILSLSSNIIYLCCLFIYVREQSDFLLVPFLSAITSMISFTFALLLIHFKFKVKLTFPSSNDVRLTLVEGRFAFITQLAPTLYNNTAIFLLGFSANNMILGFYTAASKIIDAAISLAYVLSNTFFPYISQNIKRHKIFQKIMLFSGVIATLIVFIFSEHLTRLFFDDNLEISSFIRLLSICIFLLFFSLTYGTNFLMLIHKDRLVQNITIYSSISFFLVALIAIPKYGVWGAFLVVIGARFVISTLQYWYYLKYKGSVGL